MNLFINLLLFAIGYIIGTWYLSSVILPLIYGFPRSLIGYFKKEFGFKPALISLSFFIAWNLILIFIFILLTTFLPNILDTVLGNSFFQIGSTAGFWFALLSIFFSKKARNDLDLDFQDFIKKYGKRKD